MLWFGLGHRKRTQSEWHHRATAIYFLLSPGVPTRVFKRVQKTKAVRGSLAAQTLNLRTVGE